MENCWTWTLVSEVRRNGRDMRTIRSEQNKLPEFEFGEYDGTFRKGCSINSALRRIQCAP
jgi:hypothetical protein